MPNEYPSAEERREEFEREALPHLNDLYRTALGMFANPSEAEEVAQEVYLEAWKSFHRFEPGTNYRAWLFKILFHKANHHRRKWFRLMKNPPIDEYLENTIESKESIPDNLTDEDLLAALQKVPDTYRDIILMADVQAFSYKEIAEMMEIPIGTVMSRRSRGRQHL
jgi:RNA polymerase sigma-70 factor (ECF subfamily)